MYELIGKINILCLLMTPVLAGDPKPQRVDNFSLYDHKGAFHQLTYYADSKAIVLFVQGNGCPIVRKQLPALKKLQTAFEPKGVTFFMINSNMQDNRDSVATEASEFAISMPILVDETQLVGESLGLTRIAEALVIVRAAWKSCIAGLSTIAYPTKRSAARPRRPTWPMRLQHSSTGNP